MPRILFEKLPLIAILIVSLLGCCMEIDISLPSFPGIMAFFDSTEAQVQSTLSLNFLAVCLSGLFYGPLSDAWGRRSLMLVGATFFMIGAIGCVFSFSIYQLMFWRFVQGLGASSAMVLAFSMLSDRYSGNQAANYIGKVNGYITIFMAVAPILGSIIVNYFTWRANFTLVAAIGIVSWLMLIMQLPETNPNKQPLNLWNILKDYKTVATHRSFLMYATLPNMLVTAWLTFVGNASFFYINSCELSYFQFAMHQGLIVVLFSLMSFYSNKIVLKIGDKKAVQIGMFVCALAAVLLAFFAFTLPYNPYVVTVCLGLMAIGCAFPMSVTFAQSMEVLPDLKGVCSSFIMSTRLLISSGAIAITGVFFDGTMRPVAIVMGFAIGLALWMYFKIEKKQDIVIASGSRL